MTKEQEEYFNNYFDLFLHPGWKQFITEVGTTLDQLNQIRTIKDHRDLDFRQGQHDALLTVSNYEALQRAAYDSLKPSPEDADDAV